MIRAGANAGSCADTEGVRYKNFLFFAFPNYTKDNEECFFFYTSPVPGAASPWAPPLSPLEASPCRLPASTSPSEGLSFSLDLKKQDKSNNIAKRKQMTQKVAKDHLICHVLQL